MPADLRAVVLDRLAKAYGPAIITLFMQNPDLIGGIRIKVGSDIYDGSVRSTLITLSRKLGITLTSLVGRTG
jgi:F-type H+-transporting ATPase subunit delta